MLKVLAAHRSRGWHKREVEIEPNVTGYITILSVCYASKNFKDPKSV